MELQGHWNPGVMQPLTPNNKIPGSLGWFPFPNVPGSKAIPGSLLGGGDGFACSWKAPQPQCAQFLATSTARASRSASARRTSDCPC